MSWIHDLHRLSLLDPERATSVATWGKGLIEILRESKSDHEAHLLGVSRIPKNPNFLLASTSENGLRHGPLTITLTKQTADLFLSPTTPGIRLFSGELPITITYTVEVPEAPSRRVELTFYDAIAFDSKEYSLILALAIGDETPLSEFLPNEELAELQPLIRSHGIPLLELHTVRLVKARLDDELHGMLTVMRDSNQEIPKQGFIYRPVAEQAPKPFMDGPFLNYVTSELRAPVASILAASENMLATEKTLSEEMQAQLQLCLQSSQFLSATIKNLINLAGLAKPDVKLKSSVFAVQALLKDFFPIATEVGARFGVKVKLEEGTRNIFAGGDPETLMRMAERLLETTMPHLNGGVLIVRTDDHPDRVPRGFVMLEIEDSGPFPADIPPESLLDKAVFPTLAHPRLKYGAGIFYQMLVVYLEKSGGWFKLAVGPSGGFAAQFIMPLVSRAELPRGPRSSDKNVITGF